MKNINLRNYYPDLYTSDYVIEVSDEIEELFNIDEKQEDLVPKSVEIESDSSGYSLIDYMALCVRIVVSGNNNYLWWYNIGIARKEELTAMKYSKELKDSIIRRMLPPSNDSIGKISKQEGISEQTLRNWRDNARADGIAAPGNHTFSEKWSTQDKFLIVLEAASMNETELAEYARQKGLYVEQIQAWKDACMNANGGVAQEAARLNKELKTVERENKQLEKELARKEKALAEAAALLVLRKKANAIWGEPEGE